MNSPRWAGVPFTLRSGKALAADSAEIAIHFRPLPRYLLSQRPGVEPNVLTVGLTEPYVRLSATLSGPERTAETRQLEARSTPPRFTACAHLILEVLNSDPVLFIRCDEAEEAWRIIDPVMKARSAGDVPMQEYPAGQEDHAAGAPDGTIPGTGKVSEDRRGEGDDVSRGASMARQKPNAFVRTMPIIDWLPHYERSWLPLDLLAGLSVWALVIPQALAYAAVVGVPAQYGLYTILGASALYAVFAATRQVVTGPSASVAAVTAPVAALYVASTAPEYLATVIALTLCVGVIYVLLGVFRMGWISNFLAKAVLEGFVFAVGFGLIVDQLPKILGIPKAAGSYWDVLVGVVKDLGLTSAATLTVGAVAVGLLLLLRFTAPKLPRAFIVVILGILASWLLDLTTHGVDVVGKVPTGLPSLALPTGFSVDQWLSMAVGALAIILVSYSESIANATESAAKHHQEFAPDQELVAQGAAWVGSSLVGGFPGCGSLSKTAVSESAGQKTQLAGLTVAGLTVLTLLFLAPIFTNLPQAVLGAVVIDAALGLIHFKIAKRFLSASRINFLVFAATAAGLFFVGVVAGIVFGVLLSLLLLISRTSKSPLRRMAYDPAEQVYVEAGTHPDATTPDGVLVVEMNGPLFFADAAPFRAHLLELVSANDATTVVLDLEATPVIDLDGADMLTKVHGQLADSGVRLLLTHADAEEFDMLRRAGAIDAIGEANCFQTVRAAVAAATGA